MTARLLITAAFCLSIVSPALSQCSECRGDLDDNGEINTADLPATTRIRIDIPITGAGGSGAGAQFQQEFTIPVAP